MNKRAHLTGTLCAIVLAVTIQGASQQPQSPPQSRAPRPSINKTPAPDTIRALWDRSSVVALVRIETSVPSVKPIEGAVMAREELTFYRATVLRLFRCVQGDVAENGTLDLVRLGVLRGNPVDDRVLDDGFPPFQVNGEYLMLLGNTYATPRADRPYYPVSGGPGAYQIIDDRVVSLSDEPVAIRQNGRKAASFFQELEGYARSEKK